ncbi:MAG: hypothetical protein J6S96_07325 [Muribaculaceae bacterium]|nr:hypothetical protein [Muribaculaceae bacterium]
MRNFLKYISFFILGLACVAFVGESVVRHYPNSYRLKAETAQRNADDVQTLIFGNSRTYYGINPGEMTGKALNLANVSQTLEYDCFMLENFFAQHHHNLKNVIIQVDYSNLFDPPLEESSWDWYRCTYYKLYAHCDKHSWFSKYSLELLCPSRFRSKLPVAVKYAVSGQAQLDCDSLGFGQTTTKRFDAGRMSHATQSGLDRYKAIHLDMKEYNAQFLRRMCDFCKNNGVRIIIVSMPIWRELFQAKGHDEEPLVNQELEQCRKEFGAEIKDYMSDSRMKDEDFVDAVHLSPLGAKHFTAMLEEDFGSL